MKTSVAVFLCLAYLIAVASSSFRKSDSTDRLLKEMATEYELEDAANAPSRSRRVREFRSCGRRLKMFVFQTCGGPCDPQTTNKDIATMCCNSPCSMEEILGHCCPQKV